MKTTPKIYTLEASATDSNSPGGVSSAAEQAFVELAAQRVSRISGLPLERAIDPSEAEKKLLNDEVFILVGALPDASSGFRKTHDVILENETIRFLLSHPSCFGILVSCMTRSGVDRELASWLEKSNHVRRNDLSSATPLRWSLLSFPDLLLDESLTAYRDILPLCALAATFDPTGLRALLHFVLGCRGSGDYEEKHDGLDFGAADQEPPLFAVVADDEIDVAFAHSYHLHRLGYSVLPVYDGVGWRQITTGMWRSTVNSYDVALFDDFMDFEYGDDKIGHARLDQITATHKIYVSGVTTAIAVDGNGRAIISKPVLDAEDLATKYSRTGAARLENWMDRLKPIPQLHPESVGRLKTIGLTLAECAYKLQAANNALEAGVYFQEAFALLRGHDPSSAAKAFRGLQLLEMHNIAPQLIDYACWSRREEEVVTVLRQNFATHEAERLWWTANVLQELEAVMKAHLVVGDLLAKVDASVDDASLRWQRHSWLAQKSWTKWFNVYMWLKVAGGTINSFLSLILIWLGFGAAFACLYFWIGSRCQNGPGVSWSLFKRALLASTVSSLGIGLPQDMGLCLPNDAHLWIGLSQRVIVLFLLARLIDMFVSRMRGRV